MWTEFLCTWDRPMLIWASFKSCPGSTSGRLGGVLDLSGSGRTLIVGNCLRRLGAGLNGNIYSPLFLCSRAPVSGLHF